MLDAFLFVLAFVAQPLGGFASFATLGLSRNSIALNSVRVLLRRARRQDLDDGFGRGAPSISSGRSRGSGDDERLTTFHDDFTVEDQHGLARAYHVFLPKHLGGQAVGRHSSESLAETTEKPPAVLLYHGAGSDAAILALETSAFHAAATKKGYVLAYLDGSLPPDKERDDDSKTQGGRSWSSGSASGPLRNNAAVDDVNFSAAVVQQLVEKYNIDENRVFVAGISNGGSMALRAACERPELFAGVAAIHGSLEFRRGDQCAKNCGVQGYCNWGKNVEGCGEADWVEKLPAVYECDKLVEKKMPMLIVNGMSAYGTDPSGGVYMPDNKDESESYPPLKHMFRYFSKALGCGEMYDLFKNGTQDNWSQCSSFRQCGSLEICTSSGGDWWYGEEYDITKACTYKGYKPERCSEAALIQDWGMRSETIKLSKELLRFFNDHGAT